MIPRKSWRTRDGHDVVPFLDWIPIVTSATVLGVLRLAGDLGPVESWVLAVWLAAGYAQFFGPAAVWAVGGLVCQVILAVYLLIRWKGGA